MGKFYKDYADFLAGHFAGKIQKITVNAGFSCPNRDGTTGRGGCAYCNNSSFSPVQGHGTVTEQIEKGKAFFSHKYPSMRYLAYFQSYTNTHGSPERLLALYREALAADKVVGIIIGTRPDCVPDALLDSLAALGRPVMMEYGAESAHDSTLRLVNRCHTWAQTADAVERTAARGIPVGLHLIMGLPGETEAEMMTTLRKAASLPIDTLKLHQLQIIKGTPMAAGITRDNAGQLTYKGAVIKEFTVEEYLDLCVEAVRTLRQANPGIAIERFTSQAPDSLLIAPRWGLKNYQFGNLLQNRLAATMPPLPTPQHTH